MNIKKLLLVLPILVSFTVVHADDSTRGWQVELKRAALNLTSTDVKHSQDYQDYPNSRLTADSQTLIQGILNVGADYHAQKYLWSNTLLMEYGKTTIRPVDAETTETENADRIILNTDIADRLWNVESYLGGFEAGPFASLEYETEFTSQAGSPRKKVLRGKGGLKAFEGKYIKNLYTALVAEEDMTYSTNSFNLAWESGLKIEQPIREGVKAVYTALFRDYLHNQVKRNTDIDYEVELDARMDVLVYDNLAIAPFINYYAAQGTYTGPLGQNLYIGVSFSFSRVFVKAKSI